MATDRPDIYGRVQPRVVVLPFCYTEHSFDCLLEWRQSAFVNLSWEQFFYPGNVKFKTPAGEFAVKHVLHHAWSEDYAEFARRQAIPDERVFVNGQPAYKLYDEPYRRVLRAARRSGRTLWSQSSEAVDLFSGELQLGVLLE